MKRIIALIAGNISTQAAAAEPIKTLRLANDAWMK